MWGQLGGGGGSHDEDDDNGRPGGGLWSRFKQVAAEVATDLAQPQWEEDEDEDEEDSQWEDLAEEEEEEALYEEGEEATAEDDAENAWSGEEEVDFVAEEEYPESYAEDGVYDAPEEEYEQQQPLFQQPLVQDGSAEAADNWDLDDDDLGIPEEEPFQENEDYYADGEHQEQQTEYAEEQPSGDHPFEEDFGANAWAQDDSLNLDDSHDLGGQQAPLEAQESPGRQSHGTYDTAEQHDASGWSDDLGFPEDDDKTPANQEIVGQESHESYYSAQNQMNLTQVNNFNELDENQTDAWEDDLNVSDHDEDQAQQPASDIHALNLNATSTVEPGNVENDLIDHQRKIPIQGETNPTDLNASATIDTGGAWDADDLSLSDHNDGRITPEKPIQTDPVASDVRNTDEAWNNDDPDLNNYQEQRQPSHPMESVNTDEGLTSHIEENADNAWDNDELNMSDFDETQPSVPFVADSASADMEASANADTGDAWDNDDLNLSEHQEETQGSALVTAAPTTADPDASAVSDTGDAWDNDDLNFSEDQEEEQGSAPVAGASTTADLNASANADTGNAWDNDDLNFSGHQVEAQDSQLGAADMTTANLDANINADTGNAWDNDNLNLSEQQEETQGSALVTAAPTSADPDASDNADTGDAWDNDDLNFSEHQEEAQNSQLLAADRSTAELGALANADTGDAWDNDDLNMSEHQEEEQGSALVAAASTTADLDASANADTGDSWDNDDLNFSEHQEEAQNSQLVAPDTTTVNLDANSNADTGNTWGNDDLRLSDRNEVQASEPIVSDTTTADLDASANDLGAAWDDDDDLNLSDHQRVRPPSQPGTEATVERTPTANLSTDTGNDAWDNDDLNLSDHIQTQPSEPISAVPTAADLDPSADADTGDAWDNDDLNFSEHQEEMEGSPPESPNGALHETEPSLSLGSGSAMETAADRANGGNAWYADLILSSPIYETESSETRERTLDVSEMGMRGNNVGPNANTVVASNFSDVEAFKGAAETIPDSDSNLDEGGNSFTTPSLNEGEMTTNLLQTRGQHEDDDSTVEQSNTAGAELSVEDTELEPMDEMPQCSADQTSEELRFGARGRTPSRRATLRVSNTSSAVSRLDSVEEKGTLNEKIVGTSVMFADSAVTDDSPNRGQENSNDSKDPSPGSGISGVSMGSSDLPARENIKDEGNVDAHVIRDNVSSVSEDSTDGPMPLLETQISMMTLKSVADSCPSSRQRDNDSDEDDEGGFGPVVDKTPELSSGQDQMPALSTMTINSTAVAAHSVNEDIQQDEDMDGTYYGGSTTDGGPSAENAWEEDDASSLEGLNDLEEEKIVNFEIPETTGDSASQKQAPPLKARRDEAAVDSSPRLNSSMANVYSDDNSVPSRDNDDDDEDVYKPVVDQVPKPLKLESEKSGRTLNSMAVIAGNSETDTKQDEDTVDIQTGGTSTERDPDGDQENGWGDNESLDGLSEEDLTDKQATSATDAPQEAGQVVVDNTPAGERSEVGSLDKRGGSLAAVESTDNSCPSRVHDSDEEQYGLVVDQIPESPPPLIDQMSVAASSMAVVAHNVEEDLKQDDDMDASDPGGSTVDEIGGSGWDDDIPILEDDGNGSVVQDNVSTGVGFPGRNSAEGAHEADRVVDLTPKMQPKSATRLSSNSLAVMAHSVNQDSEEEDNEEEDIANFGPIVDITPNPQRPQPTTPSSTAVLAANLKEDFKQDETTEGGIGDVNWDEECPELEDIHLKEEGQEVGTGNEGFDDQGSQPTTSSQQRDLGQVVLVDHTPEGESLKKKSRGDASLAVLAPSEDGTCPSINDGEDTVNDIDPHGEHVSYGPVVDMTPTLSMQRTAAPSTAPSVTFSLAVEACSVDEDIKRDEEMDETLAGDTTTCGGGGETGWDEDTQALDDLDTEHSLSRHYEPSGYRLPPMISQLEGPRSRIVVDHTPQLPTPRPRVADISIATLAPSETSTYHAEDSENDNDTITNDEDVYGRVVDHTPRLAPVPLVSSNSMAVGASSTDFRSEMERDEDMENTFFGDSADEMDGWEEDESALEDIEKSEQTPPSEVAGDNVVDHTPMPETQRKPKDPSVAVLVPSDDGSSVVEDDNDSQDEKHVFGPVVDVTPEQPSGNVTVTGSLAVEAHSLAEDIRRDEEMGTMFGDSTSAGGGWDEDETTLDDIAADQKEAEPESDSPGESNIVPPSADLVSDFASSHMEGSTTAGRSSEDGVVLVDHTPSEVGSAVQKNTVGWLLNVEAGASKDNTADDAAGDWAQDDAVLEDGALPDQAAEGDQVVDRVPQRPESRFGDASTLVVADPSEVLSHVDDMLQEEGNFGPVVDQTPPSHPQVLHALSGAGSTAVVAPTVVHDELDDGDESVNDDDDGNEDGWEPDPPELEQAPNPQSGNDEDTTPRVREQVVDFLPPQGGASERNRAGWSEVTTGGVPSVLQVDPKEDEFGPVVDQLPLPQPSTPFSAVSTASQVASSECEALAVEDETEAESKQDKDSSNVVVDPLPRPFEVGSGMQNLDSTASLIQSSTSDDDDDDDDDDDATGKYGPVVDHLPSIRSSLPPSRGGSTVDALATVSEVNDDDGDSSDDGGSSDGGGNDGWDDDLGDIDMSEHQQAASSPACNNDLASKPAELNSLEGSSQAEKGMTVRFRSVVAAIFDPSTKETTGGLGGEENGEGFETGEGNGWDDDLDFGETSDVDANEQPRLSNSDRYTEFFEADTPPATPYSDPKSANYMEAGENLPVGVTLPDFGPSYAVESDQCNSCANATTIDCPCVQRILRNGVNGNDSVKIDYQMLLQTEISKRRLIEEESKDLRASLEALKKSKSAGEVNMETVQTLQEYVKGVEEKLSAVGEECQSLRNQNKELQASLSEAQAGLTEWSEKENEWKRRESDLHAEIDRMEKHSKESSFESQRNLDSRESHLLEEIEQRDESTQKLSDQLGDLQAECSALREKNLCLSTDLNACRETMAQKDKEMESLHSKESVKDQEIQNLQVTVEQLKHENSSIATYGEKVEELEGKLALKDSNCEELKAEITSLQQRLQVAESEQSQSDETLTKQLQEERAQLQEQLASLNAKLEETQSLREQERNDSEWKLSELESEVKLLSDEKEVFTKKLREMQSNEEATRSGLEASLDERSRELQSVSAEVSEWKKQNEHLSAEITKQSSAVEHVCEERDSLQNALTEANETIAGLRQRLEEQGVEEGVIEEKRNKEIESLRSQLTSLKNVIAANKKQIEALQKNSERITGEKLNLQDELAEWKSKCAALQEYVESAEHDAARDETSQAQSVRELESLRKEVASSASEREEVTKERDNLLQQCKDMEFSMNKAMQDSESHAEKVAELENLLSEAELERNSLREDIETVNNERDQYRDQCSTMEQSLANASQSSQEASRLNAENTAMSNQVQRLHQELGDRNNALQELEARTAVLEEELSSERQSSHEKDEDLAELKRQLEVTLGHLEESSEGQSELPERISELETVIANFESERSDYEKRFALFASKEQELNEIAESLSQDREAALQERDALSEENEEMLVQFGYLNEQIDSFDQQILELQELAQKYKHDSEAGERRMWEMQQRLDATERASAEDGENHVYLKEQAEKELETLQREYHKLMENINELTAANTEKDSRIKSMTRELEDFQSKLEELENARTGSEAVAAENHELRTQLQNLQTHRDELNERCASHEEEVSRLSNMFDASQDSSSALQSRIETLERTCSDRDRALQQKDVEMQDLMNRLHEASGDSEESQEMVMLRERLTQMENRAIESSERAQEMEHKYEASQVELQSTRGKMSSLENTVADLKGQLLTKDEDTRNAAERVTLLSDLESKLQSKSQAVSELKLENAELSTEIDNLKSQFKSEREETRNENESLAAQLDALKQREPSSEQLVELEELENKLQNKAKTIAELTKKNSEQSIEISNLKSELATEQEQARHIAKEANESTAGEIEYLRDQLNALQHEFDSSSEQHHAREESLQTELKNLQHKLATKDGEIMMMKRKLETANEELKDSRGLLQANQGAMERMSLEIESLKEQQKHVHEGRSTTATKLLQQSKENADDVNNLRSSVISLAAALETSESRRADAIDRLLKERETHAESLRRLADSVKRFYATVSCSEK